LLGSDPRQAAADLVELHARYQTGEKPDPQALLLAARCYDQLPETEAARAELRNHFVSYADDYFQDRSSLLKQDSPDMDWPTGSLVARLSSEEKPWTLAYLVERLLHLEKFEAREEALAKRYSQALSSLPRGALQSYAWYLQGALAARLQEMAPARQAFLKLDKASTDFVWSPTRQQLIISTVAPALEEHRQKAFQLQNWRQP
ncbi:MAG TPA: hypothetical protein PKD72_03030, partial [Gemmatales bacterium]|nr:hypothetical protein [Gemmatales bacterium]